MRFLFYRTSLLVVVLSFRPGSQMFILLIDTYCLTYNSLEAKYSGEIEEIQPRPLLFLETYNFKFLESTLSLSLLSLSFDRLDRVNRWCIRFDSSISFPSRAHDVVGTCSM